MNSVNDNDSTEGLAGRLPQGPLQLGGEDDRVAGVGLGQLRAQRAGAVVVEVDDGQRTGQRTVLQKLQRRPNRRADQGAWRGAVYQGTHTRTRCWSAHNNRECHLISNT